MIERNDLGKVMDFVSNRWVAESRDPDSKLFAEMPSDFWMNSVGGKTANGGFWVTTLMYTENEADAAAFREVLLRWQSRGKSSNGNAGGPKPAESGPDLIQISRMRKNTKGADKDKSADSSNAGSAPR